MRKEKFWSDWIYQWLFFYFLLSTIMICRNCSSNSKLKKEKGDTLILQKPTNWTDDSGRIHGKVEVAKTIDYQRIVDSIAKTIKVKPNQVKAVVVAATQTAGTFSPTITPDTSKEVFDFGNSKVNYQDKWLTINGTIGDSIWHYQVKDSLSFVIHEKKKGWFKKQLYLDAISFNPHTSFSGLASVQIPTPPPKKWSIGFCAAYGLGNNGLTPFIGVGIQRSLIRF